jgi:DNA-directed RNA polymerase subunit RPC12/RpoP
MGVLMALTNCSDCGREISDSAVACPGCGNPIPIAIKASKPEASSKTIFVAAASIGLMIFVASSCTGGRGADTSKTQSMGSTEALTMCQFALKKISIDPDKADIPYVSGQESGDDLYFAWGQSTKMARMRNGLGLDVAATASCIVSKSQRKITSLTLNGKVFF